jgi:large subunit ribosomal protein L35
MPKMKTNRAAAKRFKRSASGKVRRRRAFLRHILVTKSRKQKRRLRKATTVHPANEKAIKRLLPYL